MEESDAGRDADRSGADEDTVGTESDRIVREINPSMAEWEKFSGQMQRGTTAKTYKPNQLA